jgi:hypothetical protein
MNFGRYLLLSAVAFCHGLASPVSAAERGGDQAVSIFAGVATDAAFTDSIFFPLSNDIKEIGIVGIAYSRRLGTWNELTGNILPLGENFTLEGEVGVSGRFGDEALGEAWTGLFLRYDGFPWNDRLYTTMAVNTGLSFLTSESDFERGRDENDKNSQLLHYMGPEITFSDPDNKDLELMVRFHHRSGVFGLFDGVISGSTFISSGVRMRF